MNKNWTISNGTLYRATHNHDSKGVAVGRVSHITQDQIETFCAVANKEKTIKLKIAKAKELINALLPDGAKMIKDTGMRLRPLAALLEVPYDTLQSYSCGKRNMPADVAEKIEKLIERMK